MLNVASNYKKYAQYALVWGFVIVTAVEIGFKNFLLFHSAVELSCAIIAFAIIFITLNTHHISKNSYVMFLGISYGFIGGFDLLHALYFKGMGVFSGDLANLSSQFWIIGRYLEGISILISFVFLHKVIKPYLTIFIYSACSVFLLLTVLLWQVFPRCYSDLTGLTLFKVISEYIIIAMLIAAMFLLKLNKGKLGSRIFIFLMLSFSTKILSELYLSIYEHLYGASNIAGHIFKLLSLYFVYKAIIEVNLKNPFEFLFSELAATNEHLKDDIIVHETLEEKLREERNLFHKYLSVAGVIFVVISLEQKVLLINRKGCEILGYAEDEIIGKNWFDDFILESAREKVRAKFKCIIAGEMESVESSEVPIRTSSGERRTIYWHHTLLMYDKGNVQASLSSGEDITERKRMEKQLKKYATTDHLTGVLNRGTGMSNLEDHIRICKQTGAHLTVCFVDLNGLKVINDTYGHQEGDEFIVIITSLIKGALGENGAICRLGGDEFLLVLPECTIAQATKVWEQINNKLTLLNTQNLKPYKISTSYGFAEYNPKEEIPIEELISIADNAMYRQKLAHKKELLASGAGR